MVGSCPRDGIVDFNNYFLNVYEPGALRWGRRFLDCVLGCGTPPLERQPGALPRGPLDRIEDALHLEAVPEVGMEGLRRRQAA
jgi:hypothetical protein